MQEKLRPKKGTGRKWDKAGEEWAENKQYEMSSGPKKGMAGAKWAENE